MALKCRTTGCKGRISNGRGQQKFWDGDEYACPKCGAEYVIRVTGYSIAYLVPRADAETNFAYGTIPFAGR